MSNAFGITNLTITEVTIALPAVDGQEGSSAIQPQTLKQVTFSGGQRSIVIPDGGLAVSDPLDFPVKPLTVLSVSIYLADGQQGGAITSHPGSRTATYFSFGNYAHAANLTDVSVQSVEHWLAALREYILPEYRLTD